MKPSRVTSLSFYYVLSGLLSVALGKRLDNIYWNSTNPIFDISNTDHVISVEIGDQLSIICPTPGDNYEFSTLYLVREEEYTHCVLLESSRLLGSCADSTREASLSIVFRSFSPIPGGLEFQSGQTYYVITTSAGSKTGIDNRKGGLCEKKQMKIKFEVELEKKSSRHEERAYNPKFAARVNDGTGDGSSSDSSTQVMYIIHDDAVTPDDDVSSSINVISTVLLLLLQQFFR